MNILIIDDMMSRKSVLSNSYYSGYNSNKSRMYVITGRHQILIQYHFWKKRNTYKLLLKTEVIAWPVGKQIANIYTIEALIIWTSRTNMNKRPIMCPFIYEVILSSRVSTNQHCLFIKLNSKNDLTFFPSLFDLNNF